MRGTTASRDYRVGAMILALDACDCHRAMVMTWFSTDGSMTVDEDSWFAIMGDNYDSHGAPLS